MSPEQFDEWRAYDAVEPLLHSERMLGFIAQMIYQFMGGTGDIEDKTTPWVIPEEFDVSALKDRLKRNG